LFVYTFQFGRGDPLVAFADIMGVNAFLVFKLHDKVGSQRELLYIMLFFPCTERQRERKKERVFMTNSIPWMCYFIVYNFRYNHLYIFSKFVTL
jgi:hypothetical protein